MGVLFESCAHNALVAVIALAAAGVLFARHQFAYWQRRGFPCAPPSLPFGNFGDSFMQRISLADNIRQLYRSTSEPVLGVWTMLRPSLLINDPDLIRAVCIKDFSKFADRGLYCDEKRDPLSGHLFSIGGDKWRRLRGQLSPTFTSGKLKAMFSTLVDSGTPLKRFIASAAASGDVVEMRELLAQYTTNVIASAAFGLDIDCIAEPETSFRKYGRKVFEPTLWNSVAGLVATFFPKLFATLRLRATDADVESVVRQNIEHREKNNVVRKDFFQLLMQLRNGGVQADGVWDTKVTKDEQDKLLSVDECAAQSFVFFLAGFETSSTTVSFALYELAKNPECQRRVQQEIDEVLARHNGEMSYDAVSEMKYLDWCFDETLRKYPPLPLLNRSCSEAWRIPNTDMIVEPGSSIMIPVHALQMDAQYYPDPERFWPERFNPEHGAFDAKRPYMPFGEGPRNCIGLRFGKMQSKVGLVCMLHEFWYDLAGNTTRPLVFNPKSFLLSPVGGVNLQVTRRVK